MYNSEKYIKRCIDSLYLQDLSEEEFEIIIANDGSTDTSTSIVEHLQKQRTNIVLLSQENQGAGMARNLGFQHAIGDYVMFVDSDDYLNPYSLGKVLKKCEDYKLDLCKYEIEGVVLENGRRFIRHAPVVSDKVFCGKDLLKKKNVPLDSACASLYDRHFLVDNKLTFSNQSSSEDVEFNAHVYAVAQRVMFSDERVYVYEVRNNSRRHSSGLENKKRYLMNNTRNVAKVKDVILTADFDSSEKKDILRRPNSMMLSVLVEMLNDKKQINKKIMEEVLSFAESLKVYPVRGTTFSRKSTLLVKLFNIKWIYKFCFCI